MSHRVPSSRPRFSTSLGAGVYLVAIVVAGTVTALGVHGVGTAVLRQIGPPDAPASRQPATPQPAAATATITPAPLTVRDAAMTPLQGRWEGRWPPRSYRASNGPQFGGSSRNGYRTPSFFDRLFGRDDGDTPAYGTYRTVCVRLCDGYYFPVSYSVTQDHFERDRQVCENRCGGQGRLFVYRNPGGELEDMEDLSGRPYRQLRTAFLYRTEYVEQCRCQPHPWESAAMERHRVYALAASARKGNKEAAKELQALQAQARQAANADVTAGRPVGNPAYAARDGEPIMRLGTDDAPQARPAPAPPRATRDPDWIRRAWGTMGSGG